MLLSYHENDAAKSERQENESPEGEAEKQRSGSEDHIGNLTSKIESLPTFRRQVKQGAEEYSTLSCVGLKTDMPYVLCYEYQNRC